MRNSLAIGSLILILLIGLVWPDSISRAAFPAVAKAAAERAPSPAAAPTGINYYVDGSTGSDTDPGTSRDLAWRTIQKAANTMQAGDTVTVLAGPYNQRVQITRSGSAGAPITYQAEGAVTSQGFTVRANHITIKGFEITNTPDEWDDGFGIFVEGSRCLIEGNTVYYATRGGIILYASPGNETNTSNCIVRNNRLNRNSQMGIDVQGRNHLLEGNEIWGTIQHHPKWNNPPGWVDADGIRFFGLGHTIRRNYIHDIHYGIPENPNPHIDCFQTFSDSNHEAVQNIIFEKNLCANVQAQSSNEVGQGFMIESGSHLLIRNNILQAYRGINIAGNGNITIINNIFSSDLSLSGEFGMAGVTLRSSPNTVIKNNIFYNYRGYAIYITDSASQPGLDAGHGCVFRSDGGNLSGSPYPHDLWGVNPQFANPAAGDFHLKPVSKAVDAGIELPQVPDDREGRPRPQGPRYDIGAYELPIILGDRFESGDFSAWSVRVSDGGDLAVTPPAALEGSQGMQALIDDNRPIYVQDDTPETEASYNVYFRFDPNSTAMASLDVLTIFAGYDLQSANLQALRVELRFFEGAYQVRAGSRNDDLATWSNTRWFPISDGAHQIAVEWDAAGAPGQNDGQLKLKVDGVLRGNRIRLDTDSLRIDQARLGAFGGIDDGTRGSFYFDQFVSYRD